MKNSPTIKIFSIIIAIALIQAACAGIDINDYFDDNNYYYDNYDYTDNDTNNNDADNNTSSSAISNTENNFSADLKEYIVEMMDEDQLPGAAVAVVNGDEIIFAEGFGFRDIERGLPVTTETLFHIGSTNKSMTAMMIATLIDQGLFDWDTPVVEIYPEFKLASNQSTNQVTMRDLLSMQSGIPDYAEDDFDYERQSAEDLFDYMASAPLAGSPGEAFSYSNISASLAGYLGVIATNNQSPNLYNGYERLLRSQVLDPIGMDSAVLRYSQAKNDPNYGKSYALDWFEAVETEPEDFDGDPLAPSGVVKANVIDMANYISTQLNQGVAPNGVRVVSAENLTETWKPNLENYGMGWEVGKYDGFEVISHEGAFDYYLCVIGFVPELDIGFVVLTNSEDAGEGLVEALPEYIIDLFNENW